MRDGVKATLAALTVGLVFVAVAVVLDAHHIGGFGLPYALALVEIFAIIGTYQYVKRRSANFKPR
jgi:hypothetical protein